MAATVDQKLRFKVVHVTSEDPGYPVSELNVHSPHTRGWQSARFCDYPQEIGVEFVDAGRDTTVAVSQIQLLSHQSKIATRVELFMGTGTSYATARFSRLGYFSLDNNERSKFTARELKSVYLKAQGSYLKLVLHKCYLNDSNIFSQVGLIAINVIGVPVESPGGGRPSIGPSTAPSGIPIHARFAQAQRGGGGGGVDPAAPPSPAIDLATDVGMDVETAALLREVVGRKAAAVAEENFELAKALKLAQDTIRSVGATLAVLVADKNRAVQDEDYDKASQLKLEIQRIRTSLATQLSAAGVYQRQQQQQQFADPLQALQQQMLQRTQPPQQQQQQLRSTTGSREREQAQQTAAAPDMRRSYSSALPSPANDSPRARVGGASINNFNLGSEGGGTANGFRTAAEAGSGEEHLTDVQQHSDGSSSAGASPASSAGHLMGAAAGGQKGGPSSSYAFGGQAAFGVLRPSSRAIRPAPPDALERALASEVASVSSGSEGALPESRPLAAPSSSDTNAAAAAASSMAQLQQQRRVLAHDEEDGGPAAAAPAVDSDALPTTQPRNQIHGSGGGVHSDAHPPPPSNEQQAAQASSVDPEPLSAGVAASKEGGVLLDAFGEHAVRCAFSRTWSLREAELIKIASALPAAAAAAAASGGRAATEDLAGAILGLLTRSAGKDEKIAHVFVAGATKLLPAWLRAFPPAPGIAAGQQAPSSVGRAAGQPHAGGVTLAHLDGIVLVLADKLGDNVPRVRDAAVAAVLEIASVSSVGPGFVSGYILERRGASKKTAISLRALQTRLEVLVALVDGCGLLAPGSGVTTQDLIAFCAAKEHATFQHANADVRHVTEDLFAAAYKATRDPGLLGGIAPLLRPAQLAEYQAAFEQAARSAPVAPVSAAAFVPPSASTSGSSSSSGRNLGQPQQQQHPSSGGPVAPRAAVPPSSSSLSAAAAAAGGGGGDRPSSSSSRATGPPLAPPTTTVAASAAAATTAPEPRVGPGGADPDAGLCQFCGGCGPGATEQELDVHYWQHCPVLIPCDQCTQIIEIAALSEHLLTECEHRAEYEQCIVCGEAERPQDMQSHQQSEWCRPPLDPSIANRCPLCHADIHPGREGWLEHLIDAVCPANPRTAGDAQQQQQE